jgi:hypothetical protein
VLEVDSEMLIAIESRFTEWMAQKSAAKEHFRPACFPEEEDVWNRVGLPYCQRLAEGIKTGMERFQHLRAP